MEEPTPQGDCRLGLRHVENIAAIEKAGIRAYMALKGAGQGHPFLGKEFDRLPGEGWHLRGLLVEGRVHDQ